MTISQWSSYIELWASWTDNADGSGVIMVPSSGSVNTALTGIYILSYTKTDIAGNTGNTVTRTIIVINSAFTDTDGDGNTDSIENAWNNAWDGNWDGILDSTQTNVAGAPNPFTSGYTTLETSGWCMIVSAFGIITEPSLPVQDISYSYPLWLNKFVIRCADPGMTGIVTVYYDRVYDTSQWLWRKFASGSNMYTDIGPVVAVSIGSKTVWWTSVTKVTFSIKDGWLADEDGIANARIIDPSGPAVPVVIPSPSGGWGGSSYVVSPLPIVTSTNGWNTTTWEIVAIDPQDIFNPSITDWYCYTAKTGTSIIDSVILSTDPEFKPSLAFLYAYEITKFNSVDAFWPYSNLTREQAAKIFSNFAMNVLCRKPDLSLKINYTDINNTDPSLKPYITLAYQLWLMKWWESKFRPFDIITKAEFNAVLVRMILKSYLDESWSNRYTNYNSVATDLWIIKQWAWLQSISRYNAALMLYRAYKNQLFTLDSVSDSFRIK
jgi:S-layer homology domain